MWRAEPFALDAETPRVGLVSPTGQTATFTLKALCESECVSMGYCRVCSGWEVAGVPACLLEQTEHRAEVRAGNAREYYERPVYHQEEAEQIIALLLDAGWALPAGGRALPAGGWAT